MDGCERRIESKLFKAHQKRLICGRDLAFDLIMILIASAFRLDKLFLMYNACLQVAEYGINSAAFFLRLHEDAP